MIRASFSTPPDSMAWGAENLCKAQASCAYPLDISSKVSRTTSVRRTSLSACVSTTPLWGTVLTSKVMQNTGFALSTAGGCRTGAPGLICIWKTCFTAVLHLQRRLISTAGTPALLIRRPTWNNRSRASGGGLRNGSSSNNLVTAAASSVAGSDKSRMRARRCMGCCGSNFRTIASPHATAALTSFTEFGWPPTAWGADTTTSRRPGCETSATWKFPMLPYCSSHPAKGQGRSQGLRACRKARTLLCRLLAPFHSPGFIAGQLTCFGYARKGRSRIATASIRLLRSSKRHRS